MLAEYRSCPFAAFAGRCERRAERGGARLLGFIMAAILIADAAPASAATVTGPAHVVDGDTLEMEGQRIRLFAIDAPEGDQLCYREAENWPCGQVAADKLGSMIGSSELICRGEEIDQYGRLLAVCMIAGLDLNRLMVAEGWALAFRRYSDIYSGDEAQAQAARLGMWGSTFVSPEEHRAARLEPAPSASSQPQSRRSTTCPDHATMSRPTRRRCSAARPRRRPRDTVGRVPSSNDHRVGAVGLCPALCHRAWRRCDRNRGHALRRIVCRR